MVFLLLSRRSREASQSVAHFFGSLVNRRRLSEINPGYVQMRSMIEFFVRDLTAFQRSSQFHFIHRCLFGWELVGNFFKPQTNTRIQKLRRRLLDPCKSRFLGGGSLLLNDTIS